MKTQLHVPEALDAASQNMPPGATPRLMLIATMRPGRLNRLLRREDNEGYAASRQIGDAEMHLRIAEHSLELRANRFVREDELKKNRSCSSCRAFRT